MTNIYEPMMYSILNQYHLLGKKDDYIDLCYIGYAKALKKYDKTKAKFSTYAYQCMKNEVADELRKEHAHKRQREELSFDYEYNDVAHSLKDIIADNIDIEQDFIDCEMHDRLCQAISMLAIPEQVVIKNSYNIYRYPFTRVQLSRILGVSKNKTYVIQTQALAKLKEILKDER